MKVALSIAIISIGLLVSCSEGSEAEDGLMTFCECADKDGEYANEEEESFCEKKMSDWKDRMKNGDEEAQQKAMEEMQNCIEG